MSKQNRVIRFKLIKENREYILEVPVFITANDLVKALNNAYNLQIDLGDVTECYLQMENPIALLKGNKTLDEFGVREGSIIYFIR